MWLFATPWMAACQGSLSLTIFRSLPKFMFIALVMLSSPSHSVTPSSPSALNLSQLQGLFNESSLHIRWKFQLQLHSFQWMSRADLPEDWLVWSPCCPRDFQEFSPAPHFKASILWLSAFFMVYLSYPYMSTGETIALTIQTCIGKVMSMLFNTLSRLVIAFLSRSNHLLIHGCSHCPQWFWSSRK